MRSLRVLTAATVLLLGAAGCSGSDAGEAAATESEATRIEGSADTAQITLEIGPDGAELALDDLGVLPSSDLTTGRYEVTGDHLSLAADLTQDGMQAGSAEQEIDFGG